MQNELENKQNETKVIFNSKACMKYKIQALTNTLTKKKEENTEICNQIKEVRGTAERAQKENKVLDGRLTKIQNELQSQEMMNKCNF